MSHKDIIKITDNIKAIKKGHREQTKTLNLTTRVARTEKLKKDAKAARRKWKNKGEF